MGKKYYCDYCDKTMVATPALVKTHNKGVVHQKIVNEHYQQFKDPETILKEESAKKPCSRHMRGECQFGSICRFSHYTKEQLYELQQLVSAKKKLESTHPSFQDIYQKFQDEKSKSTESNILIDPNGVSHVLPWSYHEMTENENMLPPSLRRLKAEDFLESNNEEWG
ncbi:zinc finger matrin-type protein 5 [Aricia agestis]|uniref:zinc finger matrin-type protein 5 n=1 Tax=Aricia agestis TaxID=91739 RepID=UPI001C20A191|nr:zinc finger matrin-type protein 5 [Aricia agestis]